MANSKECPLCNKTVSWPGFGKHILSAAHATQVKELLMKNRTTWTRPTCTTMPRIDIKNGSIHFCFGCNKVTCNSDAQHYSTCKKWPQHKEKIAQLLAIEDEAPAVESNGEEMEKLKREWALEKTKLLNANETL